jgi:serine phosphatase RsbU (regulator of sigma subunit)
VTRVLARTALGPAGVLRGLDEVVLDVPDALMATVGYGDYDAATGRLRYACAGHLPPLLLCADAQGRYLPGGRSQPLGMAVGVRHDAEVMVDPGALLVWFTDGLVERRDKDLDVGLDRVAQVVAASRPGDPQACCDSLITAMVTGRSNSDDVALLCLGLDRLPVATTGTVPRSERRRPESGVATLRDAGPGRSAEARGLAPRPATRVTDHGQGIQAPYGES